MEKIGSFDFRTESYLLDFQGHPSIAMIGNYLLHVASNHAASRGFGYEDMAEKRTAWVLSRLAIEMNQYPKMDEPIRVLTWVEDTKSLFTQRCFEIDDKNGLALGFARSIWAAIDVETRRPTPLDVTRLSQYLCDRPCPIEKTAKIAIHDDAPIADTFKVCYSDIDINGHLNSVKYMEHLLDLFDLETFKTKEIRRFEISYIAEAYFGTKLTQHLLQVDENTYNMSISDSEKTICRATVTWKNKTTE